MKAYPTKFSETVMATHASRKDNRADFFARYADYLRSRENTGELKLSPHSKISAWGSGSSMATAEMKGLCCDLNVCVAPKSRHTHRNEELEYAVSLHAEFNVSTTPRQALKALAFFELARTHAALEPEQPEYTEELHSRKGNCINWHLRLSVPGCRVRRSAESYGSLADVPPAWTVAFDKLYAVSRRLAHAAGKLAGEPLTATEAVLKKLLQWNASNLCGERVYDISPAAQTQIESVCGFDVQHGPASWPSLLDFMQTRPDLPVNMIRTTPTEPFRQPFSLWLAKNTRAGEKSIKLYLYKLSVLPSKVPEVFTQCRISSVFDIGDAELLRRFENLLRATEWFRDDTSRKPSARQGGSILETVLKHYQDFLSDAAADSSPHPLPSPASGGVVLSLAELNRRKDKTKLVNFSKPYYLECPGLRKYDAADWAPLFCELCQDIWNRGGEAALQQALPLKTLTDIPHDKQEQYHLLGKGYYAHKKLSTSDILHSAEKVLIQFGVNTEFVLVSFLPGKNAGDLSELTERTQPLPAMQTDAPLNTILYGPPGTGKTFHTIAYAVAICKGLPVSEVQQQAEKDYAALKAEYDHLRQQNRIAFATFHQSYEYGDFIEALAPKAKGGKVTYEVKPGAFREFCRTCGQQPSVFIIDEINRGNISKIMGELITLIEESKRETQHVRLPLSGADFTVPANVYLLGTMNTADHSLAMMDSALRRRFDFVRMNPQPELLPADVQGVDVPQMLRAMNERISWLCDAEHELGHALFWELHRTPTTAQLGHIFRKKIIPLLQEYFHDDERKVKVVLGRSTMLDEKPLPPALAPWATEWGLPNHRYLVPEASDERWLRTDTYTGIYTK